MWHVWVCVCVCVCWCVYVCVHVWVVACVCSKWWWLLLGRFYDAVRHAFTNSICRMCPRQKPCSLLSLWWNFSGRPLLYFVAPFDGEIFIAKLVFLIVDFAILSPFRLRVLINGHGFVISNEILGYQMILFHLASVRSLFSVIDAV